MRRKDTRFCGKCAKWTMKICARDNEGRPIWRCRKCGFTHKDEPLNSFGVYRHSPPPGGSASAEREKEKCCGDTTRHLVQAQYSRGEIRR